MQSTKDEALARRRAQNRAAQRRFRSKQNQQRASEVERHEIQYDVDQENSFLAGLGTPLTPVDGILDERFSSSDAAGKSGPPCVMSLFGNYTLLDFLGMDFTQPTATDSSPKVAMPTPRMTDHVSTAPQRPESRRMPSYSPYKLNDMAETITPGSNSNSMASHTSGLNSIGDQDTPMSSGFTTSTIDTTPSLEMTDSPQNASTGSSSEQLDNLEKTAGWQSPLHIAAQKGHDRIVRVLLRHQSDCDDRDGDGLTPLFHAVIGGHEDVVTSLVEHGARIGELDEQGRTALHLAVLYRRERLLKVLLKHCQGNQALVDSYDSAGRTPLHTAVDTDFEAGVCALLEHGANLNYRTRKA